MQYVNEKRERSRILRLLQKAGIITYILRKSSGKGCRIKSHNLKQHLKKSNQRLSPIEVSNYLADIVEGGGSDRAEVTYNSKVLHVSPTAVDVIRKTHETSLQRT